MSFLDQLPVLPRRAASASNPDAARMHRLASARALAAIDARQARRLAWADRLLWPFVAWQRLKRIAPTTKALAATQAGQSPPRHRFTAWRDCTALGLPPADYYKFALYRPARRALARDILLSTQAHALYRGLLAQADRTEIARLDDKLRFHDFCRAHALPTPPVLAVASGGAIERLADADAPDWQGDLIMKPRAGSNGSGFYQWRRKGEGYAGVMGETVTREEILNLAAARSAGEPVILQPRIVNSPEALRFSSGGLATIRLVTGRHTDGRIAVIGAAMKMPCGASLVDNFMRGNVLAQIDSRAGTITDAQHFHDRFVSIARHPDTGVPLAGAPVPDWAGILTLGTQVHARFPSLAILAMDIAPAAGGVTLIECNSRGDLAMIQYPGGIPLGLTELPEILGSHLVG